MKYANELDYKKTGDVIYHTKVIHPMNLLARSNKMLWWLCRICEHSWQTRPNDRFRGRNCPSCAGRVVHSSGFNSMRNTDPDLAEEFHPTLNGEVTPDDVLAGTHHKFYWICKKISPTPCGHIWKSSGKKRHKNGRGDGCTSCAGRVVHSSGFNSMRNTDPDLAEEFHPTLNREVTPDDVLAGTGIELWWICGECKNVWRASGNTRFRHGCPSCSQSGFDVTKPANLYLLKYNLEGRELYKIGITNREVKKRILQLKRSVECVYNPVEVETMDIKYILDGQAALDKEQSLKKFREYRVRPKRIFDGYTELYSEEIVSEYEKL